MNLFAAVDPDWKFLAHFPIILVVIGLVYSATRHDHLKRILWETLGWSVRMGSFLVGLGVLLYVLSTWPHRWPFVMIPLGLCMAVYYYLMSPLGKVPREKLLAKLPWNKAKSAA